MKVTYSGEVMKKNKKIIFEMEYQNTRNDKVTIGRIFKGSTEQTKFKYLRLLNLTIGEVFEVDLTKTKLSFLKKLPGMTATNDKTLLQIELVNY